MRERIVLVTGGHDYDRRAVVFQALDAWRPTLVLTGGATGADALAQQWALARNVPCRNARAHWRRYGPAAGPRRNAELAAHLAQRRAEGAEVLVLAFPGGDGAANLLAAARDRGLPIMELAG